MSNLKKNNKQPLKQGIIVSSADLRPSLMSILKGLDDAGLLKKVVTTIAVDPDGFLGRFLKLCCRLLPLRLTRGIERRFLPGFLKGKVKAFYFAELIRLFANRIGAAHLAHIIWLWAELRFDRKIARRYAGVYQCVYGMEHSSLETFKKQKEAGGLCILRQVVPYGRVISEVINREIIKFPEYNCLYYRIFPKDQKRSLARKEAEHRLADLIVANSDFVKETFLQAGFPAEKIVSIPTGCPSLAKQMANSGKGQQPLNFIFAGTLSLRKGVPYLVRAWNLLKPGKAANLWLAGGNDLKNVNFNDPQAGIYQLGALNQKELKIRYAQADVFVLPSLLEGLAHVLLEALAAGLPIITTRESGCGDLVEDGKNGLLVESGSVEALAGAMRWCLEHRGELEYMGACSASKASAWTIEDSNRAHLEAIKHFLNYRFPDKDRSL